jgi:uncharacterized membrane-anchored protein
MLADEALGAMRLAGPGLEADRAGRVATARFYAENVAAQASGLETAVVEGGEGVCDAAVGIS